MSNTEPSDLDRIIDAHLDHLEGRGPAPDLDDLDPGTRAEAVERIALLDALHGTGVPTLPDLADDPVARRFGFHRPGQEIAVNGKRIGRLRRDADLSLKDLVRTVERAGGTLPTNTLMRAEQRDHVELPQPTVSALVAALGTTLAAIEAGTAPRRDRISAFLATPRFEDLIGTWTAVHSADPDDTRRHVRDRLLVAAFRADDLTDEAIADIVQAILDELDP